MRPFCSTVVQENKSNTPLPPPPPRPPRASSSSSPVVLLAFFLSYFRAHTVYARDPALLSFRCTYIFLYVYYPMYVTHREKRVTRDGAVFFTHTRTQARARRPTRTKNGPRRRTIIERRRLKLFHAHTIERDPRTRCDQRRTFAYGYDFDLFLLRFVVFFSETSFFLSLAIFSACLSFFLYLLFRPIARSLSPATNSRPPPYVVPLRLMVPLPAGAIGAQRHCAPSAAHRPSFALRESNSIEAHKMPPL